MLDLLTVKFLMDYGTRPIHLFGSLGVVSCLLGVVAGVATLVEKAVNPDDFVHKNPSVLACDWTKTVCSCRIMVEIKVWLCKTAPLNALASHTIASPASSLVGGALSGATQAAANAAQSSPMDGYVDTLDEEVPASTSTFAVFTLTGRNKNYAVSVSREN